MKIPNFVTHGIGCTFSLAFALLFGVAFLGSSILALISLFCVAECCWAGQFGMELVHSLLGALLGCGGALCIACVIWKNAIPKRPEESELQVPAERPFSLAYATLEQRMEEMYAIGGDDEVEMDKDTRFLSWNDRACRDLVIQGLGGDDWVAFFWPYAEEDICLSRSQLAELCGREKVQLSARSCRFRPGAVAFCRGGQLKVYPASGLERLPEDYPPMQQEEAFRRWMEECTRMGGLDC